MTISSRAALTSIQKAIGHLPSSAHERVLEQMKADGLLHDDDDGAIHAAAANRPGLRHMTVLEAAAAYPEAAQRIRMVKSMAARMGFQIKDNEKIDPAALDAALRGQDVDTRMRLKCALAELRLIP